MPRLLVFYTLVKDDKELSAQRACTPLCSHTVSKCLGGGGGGGGGGRDERSWGKLPLHPLMKPCLFTAEA